MHPLQPHANLIQVLCTELPEIPPAPIIAVTHNKATRKPTHTSPLAPRSARWTRRGRRKRSPRRQQPTSLSTDLPKILSQSWFPSATWSSCRVRAGRRHLPWTAPYCPSGWRSTSPPMWLGYTYPSSPSEAGSSAPTPCWICSALSRGLPVTTISGRVCRKGATRP